ncbi:DgyrCDS1658 [Dimorphilus gyrociliatus]|uniref:DgyrCDS1658 n=1 Tax=Dimorphilus gyrociliatus TaxID=2664684 RepID=A0A7I8V9U0_9ANNE|nr:DgyrCDS1658 [Dimorphilus gyrociliatus]
MLKKFIFIALIHCSLSFPTPSEEYMREFVLKEPDIYKVYWKYDDNTITFEIHAKTKGWIGFGVSPNGGMPGSDIVMFWKGTDNKITFEDRHAVDKIEPIKDEKQDWHLDSLKEEGEFTIAKFNRKLNTCDDKDLEIKKGTNRLIWAFNPLKPIDRPIYHGTEMRGTASVALLAEGPPNNAGDIIKDSFPIDITHTPYRIPNNTDTVYRCEIFKLTHPPGKHHVVVVDPLINQDHKTLVHHIIIYGCAGNLSSEVGTTWNCYESKSSALSSCNTIMFAWAIGGGPWFFPEEIGFPLGGPNDPMYVRMETHYDNPALKDGIIDTSGLRLWTTNKLRKYDAGIIEAGHVLSRDLHVIPPKAKPFVSIGHCYNECLRQSLERKNVKEIKVFAVGLHAHLKGYQIKLRHFRDGVELEPIAFEEFYDFNFQEYQKLEVERVVKATDRLQVECSYNTENEKNATYVSIKLSS